METMQPILVELPVIKLRVSRVRCVSVLPGGGRGSQGELVKVCGEYKGTKHYQLSMQCRSQHPGAATAEITRDLSISWVFHIFAGDSAAVGADGGI